MEEIAVWGFRWAPPFAQGLVRDLRVRWALEEAGMRYEARSIDFNDRNSDEYRQLSPFGLVPAIETAGGSLFESGAILYHLAERSNALMPEDRAGRDDTIVWMFAALSTIEPPVAALSAMDLVHGNEEWAKLRRPSLVELTKRRLDPLAQWLENREYLTGRFTVADILMTTVLRFIRHTDLVAEFPALDGYRKRCEARPAFQEALNDQMAGYAQNAPVAA